MSLILLLLPCGLLDAAHLVTCMSVAAHKRFCFLFRIIAVASGPLLAS